MREFFLKPRFSVAWLLVFIVITSVVRTVINHA
jgi:hypothetical protein